MYNAEYFPQKPPCSDIRHHWSLCSVHIYERDIFLDNANEYVVRSSLTTIGKHIRDILLWFQVKMSN